jgi:BirA family biotin operon repressor/biotin-[acetyl-CoA-carboxylase] ligase
MLKGFNGMDRDYQLFKLLSSGKFHSGEDIAKAFGITRSRVWSLINSLEAKGVVVSRVRGKGYRYNMGSKLFDVESLCNAYPELPIYYFPETTSTSDIARDYAKNNKSPFIVLSEYQTGGRGRRGRQWASCYAHNLMFTYAIPEFEAAQGLDGLSLVIGLSLAEFLNETINMSTKVKWPNDLYVGDSKLAGILIELQGDISSAFGLLIGVGLNVNEKPAVEDRTVTSIQEIMGESINRTELLSGFIPKLKEDIEVFSNHGFKVFLDRWCRLDRFMGCAVTVDRSGNCLSGEYLGVDEKGALNLSVDGRVESVHAGEVSLRPSND